MTIQPNVYDSIINKVVNNKTAEVWLILITHGPLSTNPTQARLQQTSPRGGCTEAFVLGLGADVNVCVDRQFAIHAPSLDNHDAL